MSGRPLITREEAIEEAAASGPLTAPQAVEARLWRALGDVQDPEIPVSVVGMGLMTRIGADTALDYDQFLTKRPRRPDAVFAWHQDLGYWPTGTPDTRTTTCSLALDDATIENGCLRVVPGSHREPTLRRHRPIALAPAQLQRLRRPQLPFDSQIALSHHIERTAAEITGAIPVCATR